ncbi:MAG: chromosome partitioning protein ParA [Oscillospiraceae bacterium]|nr:chromosome partitioning protein ParA [Oscillospiraceae bacterium]
MKIRLAILENDKNYLSRIVSSFGAKYADELEIYSFTDYEVAISTLESSKIDVFISSDIFDIDVAKLPKRCGFAYFVDSADIESIKEQRAICKFQKADLIYKQILSVYSEKAGSISGLKSSDAACKILVFSSPCGGTGTSSLAVACAMRYAARGARTLYLNLEKFGTTDIFFDAQGQFDMSDIVFALKSKKSNLSLKLESSVRQAQSGVYYFAQPKVALDVLELSNEDISQLISELRLTGSYDYIIIDIDFELSKNRLEFYRQAHSVVWATDGSDVANAKTVSAYNSIAIMEQSLDYSVVARLCLAYNKFSNKTGKSLGDISITNIGGAPRYEHAGPSQVASQLSTMDMFDKMA